MSNLVILIFVFFIVIILLFIRITGRSSTPYKKRATVMNSSERKLYFALQKTLGDKYIILSKVRIEDFVAVDSRGLEWKRRQSFRGKIKSRHVDFLICNSSTTEPLYAIELDGNSHINEARIERDNFVDKLYKDIKLPVLHIRVGSNYYEEVERIKNLLIIK